MGVKTAADALRVIKNLLTMRLDTTENELNHPHRRRILDALQEVGGRMTAAELRAAGRVPCQPACLAFHLDALVDAGLVRRQPLASSRGCAEYGFAAVH